MRTVNPNVFPKDTAGYVFVESDGAKLFGGNWPGVVARVKMYRKRAGLPPGNPEAEVMAQACAKNPTICNESGPADIVRARSVPIKSRVLAWLAKMRADNGKRFVDEETRRSRAAICAKCPKNVALPEGCATCRMTLKALTKEVIGDHFVDGRLNAYDVLGEYLPASSNLDLQTEANGDLPGDCWRKRTL
jgi:hypothetical protein